MTQRKDPSSEGFLDALAANIQVVLDARDALLANPNHTETPWKIDSAIYRAIVTMAVDGIEAVFKTWEDESFAKIYFGKTENKNIVRKLVEGFAVHGVAIEQDTAEDYLALKYLRNTFAHAEWKEEQRQHISTRGFPIDVNDQSSAHLIARVIDVTRAMLRHVDKAMFKHFLVDERFQASSDLHIALSSRESDGLWALVRPARFPFLCWRNIERVDTWCHSKTTKSEEHAQRAIDIALESWECYVNTVDVDAAGANETAATLEELHRINLYSAFPFGILKLEEAADFYRASTELEGSGVLGHFEPLLHEIDAARRVGASPTGPIWDSAVPEHVAAALVRFALPRLEQGLELAVARALKRGHHLYDKMRNLSPIEVFLVLLPRITQYRIDDLRHAGAQALRLFRAARAWYSFVESTPSHPQKPLSSAFFERYEQMLTQG
ncbi:hypothetical protein [Sorangium sp. So ce693]|uniref:hypothetical protein n=1 Tax=Sorangium sp. So ce693 TaxID=3133318 RepID=UPI003F609040